MKKGNVIVQLSVKQVLSLLKERIGEKALARLRRGGVLKVWRCTTPYNRWVEDYKGDMLWHSSSQGLNPPMYLFEERARSARTIGYSWVHRDGGLPESSEYVLKREYLYPSKQ